MENTVAQLKITIKQFTLKDLKKEVQKVKKDVQVNKLQRVQVEDIIINNPQLFKHLLEINKGYTIVYFGAGWDFRPPDMDLYKKFNHFIFIDALPNRADYEPGMPGYNKSKDEESLIKTIKEYAGKRKWKLVSIKNNLLILKRGSRIIEYHYNTTVEDALTDPYIRIQMNKALWVHTQGFDPYQAGLKKGDLPNIVDCRAELRKL